MTAKRRTSRWSQGVWRAVHRAAAALWAIQEEQSRTRDAWWQANRATAPDSGPPTWVLTLDGHRLSGSHLSAPSGAPAGDTLAVVEALLPQRPGDALIPFLLDLHLLVTNGGSIRPVGELSALLTRAGYELLQIIDLPGGHNIVLAQAF